MALAWTLRDPRMTSTLIGASSVAQLEDSLGALGNLTFSDDELAEIDRYATDSDINLWARSLSGLDTISNCFSRSSPPKRSSARRSRYRPPGRSRS